MGKIAFVFSGQGAQYGGMGKELFDKVPAAADIFKRADKIRPETTEQCFNEDGSALKKTSNTQSCMFAVELAAAAALKDAGINCDVTAGFSLGEISALTHAGMLSFEDGFKLVFKRGELMQKASEEIESSMVAVVKLQASEVEELSRKYEHVYPVNYNCPGQTTVAGAKDELKNFSREVKAAGGKAIPLRVAGGFHSPFMSSASDAFAETLKNYDLKSPGITLYSNYTGKPYGDEDYRDMLSKQICNPVRWQKIIENMIDSGVDTFIELGPGTTLCGLIKKINSAVATYHVENLESLKETIEGVK